MLTEAARAGRTTSFGASLSADGPGRSLPPPAVRHRVRRALTALRLSEGQRAAARALRGHLEEVLETRRRLDGNRRALRQELARSAPDATRLSELLLRERQLEAAARAAWGRLERRLALLLRPEQVVRVHAQPPQVLGHMLTRLMAGTSRSGPPLA